jgi:hypothetical protein
MVKGDGGVNEIGTIYLDSLTYERKLVPCKRAEKGLFAPKK